MENFTNQVIDTTSLPRFEDVPLTPLHADYRKIMLINISLIFFVIGLAGGIAVYMFEEVKAYWPAIIAVYLVLLVLTLILSVISFKNRGYAFRTHDVIYRSGAISITTTIIPYNRVQHAALHEGWVARHYGLAAVEIFTAGGANSDIKIPGIPREQAENIKQLLMGKIQNEVIDEE